jgi:hypothetical protein
MMDITLAEIAEAAVLASAMPPASLRVATTASENGNALQPEAHHKF